MENEHLIPASVFCTHHHIEVSFVNTLGDFGLISLKKINEEDFLEETELEKLERLVRLHNELNINVEGIDVINHMLTRIQEMQDEIRILQERLKFYEESL